jgi:2-C-methyl-D-erythritol 4-phosphate cytidylyltransferase
VNVGIVLAGGIGSRFGGDISKQYRLINGKEVIWYALNALKQSENIDKIVVVAKNEHIQRISNQYDVICIEGGESRNGSLKNALDYIHSGFNCEKVIILEAARPMIKKEIIDDYIGKLNDYDAVITGQHIVDSLGCFKTHSTNRNDFYLIQAPEAFKFNMLYDNFRSDSLLTATNQQLPPDSKLFINFEFVNNNKITYHADLAYCEALMKNE